MIVKCTHCNASFAVDDSKVENKKFAFNCPKCTTENIIDNRPQKPKPVLDDLVIDETDFGPDEILADEMPPKKDVMVKAESRSDEFADLERTVEAKVKDDDIPLDDFDFNEIDAINDEDSVKKAGKQSGKGTLDLSFENEDIPLEDIGTLDDVKTDDVVITDELDEINPKKNNDIEFEDFGDIDLPLEHKKDEVGLIEDELDTIEGDELLSFEDDTVTPDASIKSEKLYPTNEAMEDESITIDLDSLDIELADEIEPQHDVKATGQSKHKEFASDASGYIVSPEEDITINLDELDIDISEDETIKRGEVPEDEIDLGEELDIPVASEGRIVRDDDDITLDLDTLDITLEEEGILKEGESLDDDEKLTLEDAGLTIDELTSDELSNLPEDLEDIAEEEDIKLTLDEIDPTLSVNTIEDEFIESEIPRRAEMDEDFNEIDDDSDRIKIGGLKNAGLAAGVAAGTAGLAMGKSAHAGAKRTASRERTEDEFVVIDEEEDDKDYSGGIQKEIPDMVKKGDVIFSIDFSIKYSRIGALMRILGLFAIAMIPHYVVFFIYNILSLILGFLNNIIVMITGRNVEDFSQIQENTLRYILSISVSSIGIVEEMPVFAGRDNIDYPLQLKVTYPMHNSRLLAGLRLSMIGMLLITIPQWLLLMVLYPVLLLLYSVGNIVVLITGRWPHVLFDILTKYYRYVARLLSFNIGIVDVYPPLIIK